MSARHTPIITELDAARIRELGARLPDGGKGLGPLSELMELVTEHAEIVPGTRIAPDVARSIRPFPFATRSRCRSTR